MDFQQLLCQLAGEHRRLEQERNELSEEVSRLRKRLSGGKAELPPEAAPLPGHVTSPTGAPRRSADSDGGTPEQLGVVAVRALAARQLKSEAAETEGHFVSVSVEAGPPSTTPTQQGPDTEWRGFTAGLLAQPHQKTLELRVFESLGEGQSPRNAGSSSVGFRALAPGVWQKRACELPADGGLVEFEVSWQPGADGVGSAGLRGGGAEARSAPVRGRSRHNTETEWLDDREQMNRARQKVRFLEVFGLDASQQGTYTVTAESLGQVLAKRGLRNVKDGFLLKALQELERVAQSKASSCGASVDSRTSALSSVVPPPVGSLSGSARLDKGIGFEIFVDAVLMSDLPKRVHPRLSRGVEKMQEALLKQDVEEVIAKLSRKRESLAMDVSVDGLAPTPKSSKVDTVLNTFVSLTVLASIVCLGLSRESDPDWEGWLILEAVFAVIFIAEINIKILMHGSRTYWCGPDRRWNWLDFTVTVVSVGDVCLNLVIQNLSDELEFSRLALVCRVFRLMRLGRVLKMIRSPLIRELSNMLVGFVLGSPALFWVSIIIWVVVALVAMSLRIAVGAHPDEQMLVEKCGHPDLFVVTEDADPTCAKHKLYAEEYCGSLSKCMFTVFRCMIGDCTSTGGQSLAAHLSAGFGTKFDFVYLTGMIVMIFGLFNVITAIFVEATMAGLKYSEAKQKLRSVYEAQYVKRKLDELVRRIHAVSRWVQNSNGTTADDPEHDASGHAWGMSVDPGSADHINLTENEFFAVIDDDVVRRILMELDIEVEGAGKEALFELMDSNCSGTVDVASMIDTLMKLRGGPMKVDMIAPSVALRGLQQELRRLVSRLAVADPAGGEGSPKGSPKPMLARDGVGP